MCGKQPRGSSGTPVRLYNLVMRPPKVNLWPQCMQAFHIEDLQMAPIFNSTIVMKAQAKNTLSLVISVKGMPQKIICIIILIQTRASLLYTQKGRIDDTFYSHSGSIQQWRSGQSRSVRWPNREVNLQFSKCSRKDIYGPNNSINNNRGDADFHTSHCDHL